MSLFGESRLTIGLWSLTCSLIALILLLRIGEKLFGLAVGVMAATLLAITPAFATQMLRPNADAIELALVLGSILCIVEWRRNQRAGFAFISGLFFGLAFQVRETAIVAAAIAMAVVLIGTPRSKPSHWLLAVLGFALPLFVEFAVFESAMGDALYRRKLALAHVAIPSSELPVHIERTKFPLFEREYIMNWHREMGIHVHWLLDGPLNLILDPRSGFSLFIAPLLLVVGKRFIKLERRRAAWAMLFLAATYICILTFVLAIDPKPRIMVLAIAIGSMSLAVAGVDLFRSARRPVVIGSITAIACSSLALIAVAPRMGVAELQARIWAARYAGAIETNESTRAMLTIAPQVRALPNLGSGRRYAMIISDDACPEWIKRNSTVSAYMVAIGERHLIIVPDLVGQSTRLCLFEYRHIPAVQKRRPV